MNGDNVNDWETTGLDPRGERDAKWKVSLDEDGVVTLEIDDEDALDYGDEFFLQGTLNSWTPEPLDRHDTIPGLWVGTITLGESGEDQFQIVADNDATRVYHPNNPYWHYHAGRIWGGPVPDRSGQRCYEGLPPEQPILALSRWANLGRTSSRS